MPDRRLLQAAAFLRAVGVGITGVVLGIHLARAGLDAGRIGLVVTAGLAGNAVATLVTGGLADRHGRRRMLVLLAAVSCLGTAVLAWSDTLLALAVAGFAGLVNGMGRDRGALAALEQAALPGTVPDADRTKTFAWYNVLVDAGHALGSLLGALPGVIERAGWAGPADSCRWTMGVVALLSLSGAALYAVVSPQVESATPGTPARFSPESRAVVTRLSALFALDALGGGFLTNALVSYWFFVRFDVDVLALGPFFFVCRLANAASYFVAERLARRIGLIATMVFTHIPSSLLLMTVPFAPSFGIAAAVFVLREFLAQMDVPTRQSYLMAVVRPEERALASGVANFTRNAAWAVAPAIAGRLMAGLAASAPLFLGGGIKIAYDLLLWRSFRRVRPPEEADARHP